MKISKVLGTVAAFSSNLYWTGVIFADEKASDLGKHLPDNPIAEDDVLEVIKTVINVAIFLAALVCVGVLVASGYSYITAAGDEQKVEKATKTLTFAIVGLVICFIAVILVQFVLKNILGWTPTE
jgi:ABC-type dipeptide/oligopeptide/nickel transport system permease component